MEWEKSLELLIEGRSGRDAQGRSEADELRESARSRAEQLIEPDASIASIL
jgi:hypothetical protein